MSNISIDSIWERIETWLENNATEIYEALPPGATDDEIAELESKVGISLHPELKHSYLKHNGSNDRAMFDAGALRSLTQIFDEWDMLNDLWGDGENSEWAEPPKEVRKLWFTPKWIPFTDSWSGDSLCIDCNPTEFGVFGQVIDWDHTGGPVAVLSKSYLEWLRKFADDLEADEFAVKVNQTGHEYLIRKSWLS